MVLRPLRPTSTTELRSGMPLDLFMNDRVE
jgi:hypothetical protein